jgi:hypothetical protein
MKNYVFLLVLVISILNNIRAEAIYYEYDSLKYIVIACSGPGDIATSSIILSTTKVDIIYYNENNYEEKLKYFSFENYIITINQLQALYNYLQTSSDDVVRLPTDAPYNLLIIDYRKNNNEDYILLTFKAGSMTEAIFFIKNLYCFMKANEFPDEILNAVEVSIFKNYLLKGYHVENLYNSDFECEQATLLQHD